METIKNKLPKVIAIGFNKCGTRSFAELFRRSGHLVIHHKIESIWPIKRRIGKIIKENISSGNKIFKGIEDYVFYCDLIHSTPNDTFDGAREFKKILVDYPDSILILNTRNKEGWIKSRLNHGHGEFAKREMTARKLKSLDDLISVWSNEWDSHHSDVRNYMKLYPSQFLEYNLDTDTPKKIINFFPDYNLKENNFFDIGRTRDRKEYKFIRIVK